MGPTSREVLPQNEQVVMRRPLKPSSPPPPDPEPPPAMPPGLPEPPLGALGPILPPPRPPRSLAMNRFPSRRGAGAIAATPWVLLSVGTFPAWDSIDQPASRLDHRPHGGWALGAAL